MRFFILIIIILLFHVSCSNEKEFSNFEKRVMQLKTAIDSNNIRSRANENDFVYKLVTVYKDSFKLNNSSLNDFEFRLWIRLGGAIRQILVNIVYKSDSGFYVPIITFETEWKNRLKPGFIANVSIVKKSPISGWKNFEKKLSEIDFTLFFNKNYEPKDYAGIEGDYYCTELLINNKYFYADFSNPNYNPDKNIVVAELSTLLNFLKKEFGIKNI